MTETFTAKYVYRVEMMESEHGWGQNYWTVDFNSEDEAIRYINETNRENTTDYAPDYYIVATGYQKVMVKV